MTRKNICFNILQKQYLVEYENAIKNYDEIIKYEFKNENTIIQNYIILITKNDKEYIFKDCNYEFYSIDYGYVTPYEKQILFQNSMFFDTLEYYFINNNINNDKDDIIKQLKSKNIILIDNNNYKNKKIIELEKNNESKDKIINDQEEIIKRLKNKNLIFIDNNNELKNKLTKLNNKLLDNDIELLKLKQELETNDNELFNLQQKLDNNKIFIDNLQNEIELLKLNESNLNIQNYLLIDENINYKNKNIEQEKLYTTKHRILKKHMNYYLSKYKKHTKHIIKQKTSLEEQVKSTTLLKNNIINLNKIINDQEEIIKQLLDQLEIKNNKSKKSIFDNLFSN